MSIFQKQGPKKRFLISFPLKITWFGVELAKGSAVVRTDVC